MDFINNWQRPITLAQAATETALDLPDGSYRLTLTDSTSAPTRWEIVGAVVIAGTATLARGLEATTAQLWPQGSVIYCGVTAGTLEELQESSPVGDSSIFRPQVDILPGAAVQAGAAPALYFAQMTAAPAGTLTLPAAPDLDVGEIKICDIELSGVFDAGRVLYVAPPPGMQFDSISTAGSSDLVVTRDEATMRAAIESPDEFVFQKMRLHVDYDNYDGTLYIFLLIEMLPESITTVVYGA